MPIYRFTLTVNLWLAAACCIPVAARSAEPMISEFMASNSTSLADEDGDYPDWIEIYNPDAAAVNLNGWYLTDSASNKLKWQFPAVSVPGGGYLIVFASDKNRRDPAGRLHTNFGLDSDGEYLALVKADGATVVSEFSPEFPNQQENVSFGYPEKTTTGKPGYLNKATPGAANSGLSSVGIAETPEFSQAAGPFRTAFNLALSGAGNGLQIRYVVAAASAGARTPEPTAASTLYTTPIPVRSSVVVRAALFTTDGRTRGATRTVYYSMVSSALSTFTSALPVIVIDSLGSGALAKDGVDHASWLYAYKPRANHAPVFSGAPDLISPMEITVRGATSAQFPKKGYNLSFTDEMGRGRAPQLLDLSPFRKWALVAPWKYDPNYINNAFVYSLSNRLGRWAPRTRLAEVYFNATGNEIEGSDYAGIYVLTDRIEVAKNRVDLANLSPNELTGTDVTGGYILKIDFAEPQEIGWRTSRGIPGVPTDWKSSVVLVSPSEADIAPAQLTYIKDYVQRMENALFTSRESNWSKRPYLDYIDRSAWVDHHLLNTLVANPDAFLRSAYFSKDRKGKLVAGPVWDYDRAVGCDTDDDVRSFRYDVWSGVGAADVWRVGWWGVLTQDPEFMQDWVDRWQALRRTELAEGSLTGLIDTLSANLAAAAARDAQLWRDNASSRGSYAAQISFMKGWISQRAQWIDRQFLAAPTISTSGNSLILTPPAGAEVVYTLDGSDPRSLGGAVAPNALRSSSPVTVAAATNIHARSYNPSRRSRELPDGTFEADNPWSSAAGTANSSPLTPVARLANISSRAVVEAGANALIVGVVVADTEAKRYLSRAVGPALGGYGVTNFVPDPQLSIFSSTGTELFRNNGWESGPDVSRLPTYAQSVGAFAFGAGSADSALASDLSSGNYTVQITTPSSRSGVGLAELYELDANGRTVNLSTRAYVRTEPSHLVGGFYVQGPAYKRMLVRAIGPTLGAFGVGDALRDPVLTINSSQGIVATNDRWETSANLSSLVAATASVGAFSLSAGSEDAALLTTLPPGPYTVEVKGKNGGQGIALLEIYEVP